MSYAGPLSQLVTFHFSLLTTILTNMHACSPYDQFPVTGSALRLPGRPLQPKIHHDLWPEYVDCDLGQQLFCHKVGKEERDIITETCV